MKCTAAVIEAFGDVDRLCVREVDVSKPGTGHVLVRVLYSALSGADINMRRGAYPMRLVPPFTPGYSVVGEVLEIGSGCRRFQIGDRVACLTITGGQCTLVNLPERRLQLVPTIVDPKLAVCLVLDYVTAYQMLVRKARVRASSRVFIHGASGGVGFALVQLGKDIGVEVLGTASATKHRDLQNHGVEVFDYRDFSFVERVREVGGVDTVFDPLGFESFDRSFAMLRKGGILIGYGFNNGIFRPSGMSMYLSLAKLFIKNLNFLRKRAIVYSIRGDRREFAEDFAKLITYLEKGRIQPVVKKVFALDQIRQAHEYWRSGGGIGTIVIRLGET